MTPSSLFPAPALRVGLLATILSAALVTGLSAQSGTGRSFGDPELWQWPPSRTFHIEHYKLALRFDEPKGEVFGDETITLRPFQLHFRKFYLDSTELTIESVALLRDAGSAPVDHARS
jgi:aminopeptidase N